MSDRALSARVGRSLGLLIGLLGLGFVVFRLVEGWPDICEALENRNLGLVAAALAAGLVGMSIIGLTWRVILKRLDASLGVAESLYRYFVGQLGKYVPGGIWPIVGRAEMARRGGVSGSAAYGSTLISLASTYLAAVLLAGLLLPLATSSSDPDLAWVWWVLLVIPLGVLLMHPKVLELGLATVRRFTTRELVMPIPSWSFSIVLIIRHIPAWLAISVSTYLVMLGVGGSESFFQIGFATSLSWFVGFVVVGLPGGIGVREAVFVALAGSLGPGVAAVVALVSRMVFILVDVLGAGIASLGQRIGAQRKVEI